MPLENPIIEVLKPKMILDFLDTKVPENIVPILELLRARAQPYRDKTSGIDFWEITTQDGKHYIRVQQHYILDDESEWTRMIGMLLDYAASQEKQP
jgi:hypothetical protein